MASLTPTPVMQFFDDNGDPLSGGTLRTFQAGTLIPLATYTDSTGVTPNPVQIPLNARGEAAVWLGSNLYYMELHNQSGSLIWTADNVGGGSSNISFTPYGAGKPATNIEAHLRGAHAIVPDVRGFFADEGAGANIHRFRDRALIGDASEYTGNRLGSSGYGSSWITDHAASWIVKNSFFAVSTEDGNAGIGILGASRTAPGIAPTLTNCGVAGLTLNEGTATFGRAFYAEAMHKSLGGATVGMEIQVGNYTAEVPIANAYSMGSSKVNGLYIGAEGGGGYTTGDADTPITPASTVAGAAIDISGGSLNAAYQKWTTGIVFRSGALTRDGSGFATAMSMAQKDRLQWEATTTVHGASIWSEVTNDTQQVGMKFENRRVKLLGYNDRILIDTLDDSGGAGAVNYPLIKNSRTGVPSVIGIEGADANTFLDLYTKGIGTIRFQSHGGTSEHLRVTPGASLATDFLTVAGSAGLGGATLGSGGVSANIDVFVSPKGTGVLRFGTFTGSADVACNGYVTIKDSAGTLRKIMITA